MMFDLPEPRDAFLGPEIARDVQRIASVRGRMEEDALAAEVVRVLREKGYAVTPPGASSPLAAALRERHWMKVHQAADGDWPICNQDGTAWPCFTEQTIREHEEDAP